MVEHALDRIRAKTYGTCEECGSVIAKKRLEAIPFAALCIRCAEKLEQPAGRPRQPR
jgi:DnaK suppressor protein